MPAVLRDVPCHACGKAPTFCDPDRTAHYLSGTYRYTCPDTRKSVTTPVIGEAEPAAECPEGAVLLTRCPA